MLLECYKAIENTSARMLEAARVHDWDAVLRCESDCAALIAQLRLRARTEQLDPQACAEKTRIMRRILSIDAKIRFITEPWLAQCEHRFAQQPRVLH